MDKTKNVYNTVLQLTANVLIYGRLWIAICVFCFVQSSFAMFRTSFKISPYAILMALGSYLFYIVPLLYYGIKGVKRASNPRQLWVEQRMTHLYATGVCVLLLMLGYVYFHRDEFFDLAAHGLLVALLGLLYMLPLIPFKGKYYALRQIGWLKPFMLAFVWWYMGAYLLATHALARESCFVVYPPPAHYWILALQFVFLLVLCVLFDIRDYDNDKTNGIKTWPVGLGISVTQKLLGFKCILCVATIFFLPIEAYIKITYIVLFAVLTFYTTRKLTKYPWWFYDIGVDGLMIVQWILLLILQFFGI